MMRTILVNWKWLHISCLEAGEDLPLELPEACFEKLRVAGTPDAQLIIVNVQREEAEFDDEDELYDPVNEFLAETITEYLQQGELLLLLHKNTPHFYSSYDLEWFASRYPDLKAAVFGGGEDFIYDLHNPTTGLLDQVGSFSREALLPDRTLKKECFDALWSEYYRGEEDRVVKYATGLIRILDGLLDTQEVSGEVKELAAGLLGTGGFQGDAAQALQCLAKGEMVDVLDLRNEIEKNL